MKIGLTQRILMHRGQSYDSIDHAWYQYLAGHELTVIPNVMPVTVTDIDVLIITGGDDHPQRNRVEQELVNLMFLQKLPVIGICHGCQLLTRMLGGRVVPTDNHQDTHHTVRYHDQEYLVNSYHKLRIEQSPPGATVLARDPENYAESWIKGSVAGVMWHPERMAEPWIPREIEQLLGR